MPSLHVFCGLGNPGERYSGTRHNVGFDLADALRERHGGRWSFSDETFALARTRIRGHDVLLVKPQTYMNLSGDAVEALGRTHEFRVRDLMVACDDIALPEGMIRVRRKGSDGGHNGLASIIDALGTTAFPRLRLGVGSPPEAVDAADYVLEPMDGTAMAVAAKMIREAVRGVETWIDSGIDVAMNRFNRRVPAPEVPEAPDEGSADGEKD
jgi:PTH1 family peptidyl-tRNA hydrolase